MESAVAQPRSGRLDEVAETLPKRVVALSRLFLRRTGTDISRTEVSVMSAIADGPRRITELACFTGVTQPAISLLVNRLQERGWVVREPDPADRRAVRVALTPAGNDTFVRLQAEYRALMHDEMASLSDEEIEILARATQVIDHLLTELENRETREV